MSDSIKELEEKIKQMFDNELSGFGKSKRKREFDALVHALAVQAIQAGEELERVVGESVLPEDVFSGLSVVGTIRLSIVELDGMAVIGLHRGGEVCERWEVLALGLGDVFTDPDGKYSNPVHGSIHSVARISEACARLRDAATPKDEDYSDREKAPSEEVIKAVEEIAKAESGDEVLPHAEPDGDELPGKVDADEVILDGGEILHDGG